MTNDSQNQNTGTPAANAAPVSSTDLSANLRRLDRLANVGLVSASVAHEIKNGLVAISTFVELLALKSDDKEMAAVVSKELHRINALVTQMLRFAAPKPATFGKMHAHELLDHSLRLIEHQMQGRLITLQRDFRAEPDVIHADESQLQQVFMNLLLNAVDAVGNNGEVTVGTENAGEHLLVFIRDTGVGIPQENLSRMFEPFFTTKKNGTGLGLAICRRIVEEHRGKIGVHSQPGKGSAFIVTLPRA
jgi:two-component system, NtrC family, sensor histidine kinase HydH